jgi:nucleobase:cation symporter-1, NCS1 family
MYIFYASMTNLAVTDRPGTGNAAQGGGPGQAADAPPPQAAPRDLPTGRRRPPGRPGPPGRHRRRPAPAHDLDGFRVVPEHERHGRPRQQAAVWAGSNLTAVSLVLGGVASAGLGFRAAACAITAGAAAGAAVLGLLAAQGPRLGVPQLVHARALFGTRGAAVLSCGVLLLTTGFGCVQLIIQGAALHQVTRWPVPVIVVACAAVAAVLALAGRARLAAAVRATAVLAGVTVVLVMTLALASGHVPAPAGPAPAGRWLGGAAVMLMALLGWGPITSDFTTRLPARHGPAAGAWAAAGAAAGTIAAGITGAYVTAAGHGADTVTDIGQLAGPWVLLLIAASVVATTAVDFRAGGLQLLLLAGPGRAAQARGRGTAAVLAVTVTSAAIALATYRQWGGSVHDMLAILLLLFVPWTSCNLTDYYLVRRGKYDVTAMLGTGRPLNARGLCACLAGLAAEIPCTGQSWYTGPAARLLGGADLSWLAGGAVTCAVYLAWAPLTARLRPAGRHARPPRILRARTA